MLGSAGAARAGRALFLANCAVCHGASGDGHGQREADMLPAPANLTVPPWSQPEGAGRTFLAIRHGVAQTAMAPWSTLTDRQTWQLVAYIQGLPHNR